MKSVLFVIILFGFLIELRPIELRTVHKTPDTSIEGNVPSSTFDVLYITPGGSRLSTETFILNQKTLFGGSYDRGWLLPSDQPIDLDLYLYYDGQDESKIRPFLSSKLNTHKNSSSSSSASSSLLQSSIVSSSTLNDTSHPHHPHQLSKSTLTLYFTPEDNCEDFLLHNYRAFQIVERIASNMYKAELSQISLPYSERPLYICMQQFDVDENIHDQFRYYSHQGNDYWVSIITTKEVIPIWARIILFFVLLTLSGLFSGLNLGLMSLDLAELDILKRIGTPQEKSYASKIYPLRKRGNFLLCTILLGNVLVNSVSTLILGDMLSGVYAAFGSTLLIVIFGEIIPQAACSKHGLAVGANTRFIMYLFMVLTSPLSFPLSIILDKILGQEIVAPYSREKIRELMNFVDGLDNKEKKIISGALDFNKKKVREVMTPIENVFMLELHSCLDFESIAQIAQEGFSRIPVYEGDKENVVGLLHVKDFTLLDPDDNMPVEALLKFYNHPITYCDAERYLDSMFEEFRKGETHLAFVQDVFEQPDSDPIVKVVGIVTLEDILEELVQMEIYDEFDDKKEIEHEERKIQEEEEEAARKQQQEGQKEEKSQHELEPLIVTNKKSQISKTNSSHSLKNNTSDEPLVVAGQSTLNGESIALKPTNYGLNPSTGSPQPASNELSATNADKAVELQQQVSNKSNRSTSGNATTPSDNSAPATKDLSIFLQQQKDASQRALISPQIRFVMFQFLFTTVRPFTSEFLTRNVLGLIFKKAVFKESKRIDHKQPPEYLYRYGRGCHYFILILSGEATIEVGKERLEFPAGPFAYFGENTLLCGRTTADQVINDDLSSQPSPSAHSPPPIDDPNNASTSTQIHSKLYVPDFSLRVDDRCVYMKIDHDLWRNGVIKSQFERQNNQITDSIDYVGCNEPLISSSAQLNELTDPSKLTHFHHSIPSSQFGLYKENMTFSAYHPHSPNIKGGAKPRRSTITAAIMSKVQQAASSEAEKEKHTSQPLHSPKNGPSARPQPTTGLFTSSAAVGRIKESVIQESDDDEEAALFVPPNNSNNNSNGNSKDISTSYSNIVDESSSTSRRRALMDKQKSFDH